MSLHIDPSITAAKIQIANTPSQPTPEVLKARELLSTLSSMSQVHTPTVNNMSQVNAQPAPKGFREKASYVFRHISEVISEIFDNLRLAFGLLKFNPPIPSSANTRKLLTLIEKDETTKEDVIKWIGTYKRPPSTNKEIIITSLNNAEWEAIKNRIWELDGSNPTAAADHGCTRFFTDPKDKNVVQAVKDVKLQQDRALVELKSLSGQLFSIYTNKNSIKDQVKGLSPIAQQMLFETIHSMHNNIAGTDGRHIFESNPKAPIVKAALTSVIRSIDKNL